MIPAKPVAVVELESVVEVVVPLPQGDQSGPEAVACGVLRGEGLGADRVREGIDSECRVPLDDHPKEPSDEKCAQGIPPGKTQSDGEDSSS